MVGYTAKAEAWISPGALNAPLDLTKNRDCAIGKQDAMLAPVEYARYGFGNQRPFVFRHFAKPTRAH